MFTYDSFLYVSLESANCHRSTVPNGTDTDMSLDVIRVPLMLRAYPGAGVGVGYGVFVGLANRFAGVGVTTGVAVGVGISVGTIAGVAVAAGAVVGAGVGVGEGVAVGSVAGAWVGVAWTAKDVVSVGIATRTSLTDRMNGLRLSIFAVAVRSLKSTVVSSCSHSLPTVS